MSYYLKFVVPIIAFLALTTTGFAAFFPQPAPGLALPLSAAWPRVSRTIQPESRSIPRVEAIHNLGVPSGNVRTPRFVALDEQAGQLYILAEGNPGLGTGNILSVYDIETGAFLAQIVINQKEDEPLDLKFDPETGFIYALWQPRYSDPPQQPTLSIIDSRSLEISQELVGARAIAADHGLLYLASDEQITGYEILNGSLNKTAQSQLPAAATGPFAFNSKAGLLYLARSVQGQWQVDIYDAATLTLRGSSPIESPALNILPIPDSKETLVIVARDDLRALYSLTAAGELADLAYQLGPRYGAGGVALSADGKLLYFSNGQLPMSEANPEESGQAGPALVGIKLSDLTQTQSIPLLYNVDALVVANDGQAFGLAPFAHHLYAVDLENEAVEIVPTAVTIRDVVVDELSQQMYISDSANRIRKLDSETLELLGEVELASNLNDYGFQSTNWAGELALDKARGRLYVSGLPAVVLDINTLAEVAVLEPGGQLAPDPEGDEIYVSNCGITVFDAETLSGGVLIPGSGPRPDGLAPNPCVIYSQLDSLNQLLYSLAANGVAGSNAGNYLYVYDLEVEPTVVFSDTDISIVEVAPDPAGQRAFVSQVRHSNRRLRTLDAAASPSRYNDQLLGLWGGLGYSPAENQLYVSDHDYSRLLTLKADDLSVIGETALPLDDDYRLVGLDSRNERLYLAGSDGQLLVAAVEQGNLTPEGDEDLLALLAPRDPDGSILTLKSRGDSLLARIEASVDEYSANPWLYASSDGGQTWTNLSQSLPVLPVQALAVSPDYEADQTLLAGLMAAGQTGGLYKSTDGGQSWPTAMAGLADLWVEDLFISPRFSETGLIFAKTTYAGLHQSNDSGQTWTPLASLDPNRPFLSQNEANTAAFSDEGTVLTSQAVGEVGGLFRASVGPDETLSEWQQVFDIPLGQLALSPDGRVAIGFGAGLWRSADGGETWEAGGAGLTGVEELQPRQILFSPTFGEDETIYFFFTDISGGGSSVLFRSTDAGQSWQPWIQPAGGERVFTSITFTAGGDFLFGDNLTQVTHMAPSDLRWAEPVEPALSFPIEDLAVSPGYKDDQTLFAISSQFGLYKTTDGGQSWRQTSFPVRSYGFSLTIYKLAISPAYPQDETIFVATGRSLHRSTDGGESWQQIHRSGGNETNQKLSFQAQQIAISPSFGSDQTLLVSTPTAIYRSTDGGEGWQEVLTPDGETSTTDILTFAADGERVYARFGYGYSLFMSNDGGQQWEMLASNQDELFFAEAAATGSDGLLTVAPEFDRRLLQTNPPHIDPWQEISETLPEGLASVSAVAQGAGEVLFMGGQGGIFSSSDNGQSWQNGSGNLPSDVIVSGLDISDRHLFATTASGKILTSADDGSSWIDISVVK